MQEGGSLGDAGTSRLPQVTLLVLLTLTNIDLGILVARRGADHRFSFISPPRHGSSPAPNVCGGAQRGVSLATGIFTGESRRKVLRGNQQSKCWYFRYLGNHDLDLLDSFVEATRAILRKPLRGSHPSGKPPQKSRMLCAFGPRLAGAAPVRRDRNTWPGGLPAGPCGRR